MKRPSLYEQLLGTDYADLPPAVQRFHRLSGHIVLDGWVETQAPRSTLARVLAYGLGTPRGDSNGALRFELEASAEIESWTRHFPTQRMISRMRLVDGHLEERLGTSRLSFKLLAVDGSLQMDLTGMRFCGIPCPKWLMPRIVAQESGTDDRLHFRVIAALPWIGVVASYRGHLDLGSKEMQ